MNPPFMHVSVGQIIEGPIAAFDGTLVRPASDVDVHFVLGQVVRPSESFTTLLANILFLLWSHVTDHVILQFDSRRQQFVTMWTRQLLRMDTISMRGKADSSRKESSADFALDLAMMCIVMLFQAVHIGQEFSTSVAIRSIPFD